MSIRLDYAVRGIPTNEKTVFARRVRDRRSLRCMNQIAMTGRGQRYQRVRPLLVTRDR